MSTFPTSAGFRYQTERREHAVGHRRAICAFMAHVDAQLRPDGLGDDGEGRRHLSLAEPAGAST